MFGFDLFRLTPWLPRIHHSDDLDFQDALIEYVASLNDAHDLVAFPTTFFVSLGFTVDIYDGTVLIDSINRLLLPVAQFPFGVGDELLSLDGTPVQTLIASLRKYAIAANERSTARVAASRIVSRSQQLMPHTGELADAATIVVRLAATGAIGTFTAPWRKSGIPVNSQGPVPSPRRGNGTIVSQSDALGLAAAAAGARGQQIFKVVDIAARRYAARLHGADSRPAQRECFTGLSRGPRDRFAVANLRSAGRIRASGSGLSRISSTAGPTTPAACALGSSGFRRCRRPASP